ncbi:anthrone oxygenase family protein [Nonomuraea aurantiaca]|jgi:uncharacterized membrane protein|uniref:anthrone oxygenase family protein n=1 Tax=Nonomuraea aurantiaca TaxID=2878562 RepID=UPI001CD930D6|nr:DUF1772 domain-containing protein [Nonomuraea aurantiaca]MCA2228512.1 DUF1772 domain-containing protein [Nonomuraea aurantiaca]
MITDLLSIAALVGSGVVAGVLFAVALSVLPALFAMPADRYVYTHQLVGRRWDPTMPIIVLSSMTIDVVLAVLTRAEPAVLFATAAVLLLGVSVVSHFCNVPINRVVKSLDPDEVPPGWRDPRPLWRRWHLLRTALALLGVTVNAVAVVLG